MYSPSLEHGNHGNPAENALTPREQMQAMIDAPSREQQIAGLATGALLTKPLMDAVPKIAATGSLGNELARLGLGGARFLGAPMMALSAGDAGYQFIDGVFDHIEEESDKAKGKQRDNYEKREEMMPGVVGVNDNPLVIEKTTTMEFTPMPMEQFMPEESPEDIETILMELENLEPFK